MSHPKDWAALPCPECGERTLLAYGSIECVVLDCPGPAVRVWGQPLITVPIVASEGHEARCWCNRRGCGWGGTISEAKRKARESNPHGRQALAD